MIAHYNSLPARYNDCDERLSKLLLLLDYSSTDLLLEFFKQKFSREFLHIYQPHKYVLHAAVGVLNVCTVFLSVSEVTLMKGW